MADSGMQFRSVSRREFLNYVWVGSLAIFMAATGGAMLAFAMPRFKEGEFGGMYTDEEADWPRPGLKNESCESELAARTHSQYKKNDRSGVERLSKIAHMWRLRRRSPFLRTVQFGPAQPSSRAYAGINEITSRGRDPVLASGKNL